MTSDLQTGGKAMEDKEERLLAEEILLQKIVRYIDEVPSASLQDVRDTFALTARDFTNLFHRHLNTSPTEYLRNKRIKRAKWLLTRTRKSIDEISRECGIGGSALGTLFRKYVGCNPTDYRRQYLRKKYQRNNKLK